MTYSGEQVGVGGGVVIAPIIVGACPSIPQKWVLMSAFACSVSSRRSSLQQLLMQPTRCVIFAVLPRRLVSGTSLVAVLATAAAASSNYFAASVVDPAAAALIAAAAVCTAPVGAWLTTRLDAKVGYTGSAVCVEYDRMHASAVKLQLRVNFQRSVECSPSSMEMSTKTLN